MIIHRLQCLLGGFVLAMLGSTGDLRAGSLPQGPGWHELPNTALRPHCPSEAMYPGISGGSGCAGVIGYSGASFDAARNRLLIQGGGHFDWGGNEVYELDLDTVEMRRLNAPSYPLRDGCLFGGTYADGRPVSRHTYNQLEYLPEQDRVFMFGGSRWSCGFLSDDTWTYDTDTDQWFAHPGTVQPRPAFSLSIVHDPVSGLLYARDANNVFSYDPQTQAWTKRSNDNDLAVNDYKSGVIHPGLRRYFFFVAGSRVLHSYDISSTTAQLSLTSTPTPSCAFMDSDAVGWNYDPELDRLVAWRGGNEVYLLDASTSTCSLRTISGGPTAATWIYGRFRYSTQSRVHVSCNRIDDNCYILRLADVDIFSNGFEN